MFNKIAVHAKSSFQSSSLGRLPQPVTIAAARMLPLRAGLAGPPSLLAGGTPPPSVRSRSASFMPMPAFPGRPATPSPRDWPSAQDRPEEIEEITTAGAAARRACEQAPRTLAAKLETRELAFRTGIGIEPGYSQDVTALSMLFGLERSVDTLLEHDGAGVAAGLQALALQPGDAVAELNPTEPGLAVRLALDGAQTYLALTFPNRLREISGELARFAEGKTCGVRTLVPGVEPLPASHYREGARQVARRLVPVKAAGFDALPQDIPYKALIARGSLDLLDPAYAEGILRDAGRMLQPGGGLVFEFAHAAGTPADPKAKVKLGKLEFRQLDEWARRSGLALRCMNVRFRLAESPQAHVIAPRRVAEASDGIIDLRRADAAAWTGWNEIARLKGHVAQPVLVDVSGVFVKTGWKASD